MKKVNIQFGGMTNVPDDSFAKDGDMNILMNLRHVGGELRPREVVTEEVEGWNDGSDVTFVCSVVKYHAVNDHRLAVVSNGRMFYDMTEGALLFWAKQPGDGNNVVFTDFVLMGNVVCLYRMDGDVPVEPLYALWRGNEYVLLGVLPRAPRLDIPYEVKCKEVVTDSSYYTYLKEARENNAEDLYHEYVRKGFLDSVLNSWYADGGFVDRAMFRVALRLFDGSYVSYSPIYFTEFNTVPDENSVGYGGGKNNFLWRPNDGWLGGMQKFVAYIVGFIPEYLFEEYDLSLWQDVIVSVDLFTTGSIPYHKAKMVQETSTRTEGQEVLSSREYEDYVLMPGSEIISSVTTADRFYKIAEFDLKGNRVYMEENTSPSELAVKDVLPDLHAHTNIQNGCLLYNSKLHIYNLDKLLFEGYHDLKTWFNYRADTTEETKIGKIAVITTVVTDDGEKRVVSVGTNLASAGKCLSPFLVYPDMRATKMDIYIMYDVGDLTVSGEVTDVWKVVYRSFELTRHKTLDMAYYIHTEELPSVSSEVKQGDFTVVIYNSKSIGEFFGFVEGSYEVVYDAETDMWMYGDSEFPTSLGTRQNIFNVRGTKNDGDIIVFTLVSGDDEAGGYTAVDYTKWDSHEYTGEETAVFNDVTISFDTEKGVVKDFTVDVSFAGLERLRGVLKVSSVDNPFYFPASQTYRFDAEIVALASNTDAISQGQFGQFPLFVFTKSGIWAMQVDTSGKGAYVSQTPFSREVCNGTVLPVAGGVVFTTDKGVMIISGGEVAGLSDVLDGKVHQPDSKVLYNFMFAKAGLTAISPVPIREFVKGAVLAYNYLYNEVLVSNKDYGYSYVYGLETGLWSVTDTVFNYVTNSYPELVVYDNDVNSSKRIEFRENEEKRAFVAITRPVKAETLDFKRLRQAALRCTFTGCVFFYLLGSNDGVNFVCVTGKEYPSVNGDEDVDVLRRDLVTSMSRSKQYRFIAVAVVGRMDGAISLAELLVDGDFANNKLR